MREKHLGLTGIFLLLFAAMASAGSSQSVSVTTNDNIESEDCAAHFSVSYDNLEIFRAEEQHTLPRGLTSVHARGARSGGISARSWNRPEILVKACKAVAARDQQEADSLLKQMGVKIEGGNVTATGPAGGRWWVHFLVRAPRGVKMQFETTNGPISLRDIEGDIEAHSTNGPVSIKHAAGNISAEAVNGPISIADSRGNVKLSTRNGPIDVRLSSETWQHGTLVAEAHNGPLNLVLPPNLRSAVEVEAQGFGPFSCVAPACEQAEQSAEGSTRRVRLGPAGQAMVRLSTVNGPVKIKSTTF